MAEIWVQDILLGRDNFVESRKLGRGWTHGVHEANSHQHLPPNARRKVLYVYVSKAFKELGSAFVLRIK